MLVGMHSEIVNEGLSSLNLPDFVRPCHYKVVIKIIV